MMSQQQTLTKCMVVLAAGIVLLCLRAPAANFRNIHGQAITGELRAVESEGVILVEREKGTLLRLPSAELMRIEFSEGREPEQWLEGVVLYLPGGQKICGSAAKLSQTAVEVRSPSLGRLKLPLEKLLAVEFRRPGERPQNAEKMCQKMLRNQSNNDIAFLVNGDEMPGILVGFDADGVTFKTQLGEMPLERSRLFGLSFAAHKHPSPPPSLLAVAQCTDGSVVRGTLAQSEGRVIKLALLAGLEAEIEVDNLIAIRFEQGKLIYLSDLEPAEAVSKPYFAGDHTWPYRRDQSYDRKPIRLARKTYRKGLGTFSGMKLTYNLGGEFEKFVSLVGIDDADVNRQGDVTVRVLADGEEIFNKQHITCESGPVKIELSMKGVNKLQLVVDFGGNMYFGDLTDWANAHLIR